MSAPLKDAVDVESRLARLQDKVDRLEQRGRFSPGRVLRLAGVLLFASALGFGALTAAGVEAIRIDEQGNIHILGAVTIGGATTVGSLTTQGAVTGASVVATGAVTGNTVTSTGVLSAGSVTTGGQVAANSVTAATLTGTNVAATGEVSAATADISGLIVDTSGNMTIPGNLSVKGESNRLTYTSNVVGVTTPIDPGALANICGDADGCEVRMAMRNYDTIDSAPAPLVTWLFCDATCTNWRTSLQLLGGTPASAQRMGRDKNDEIQHILHQKYWSCYFTDGQYLSVDSSNDAERGFGLLTWVEYAGSDCVLTIID